MLCCLPCVCCGRHLQQCAALPRAVCRKIISTLWACKVEQTLLLSLLRCARSQRCEQPPARWRSRSVQNASGHSKRWCGELTVSTGAFRGLWLQALRQSHHVNSDGEGRVCTRPQLPSVSHHADFTQTSHDSECRRPPLTLEPPLQRLQLSSLSRSGRPLGTDSDGCEGEHRSDANQASVHMITP